MTQRERLKELGLFSLAKRTRGNIIAVNIYLTESYKNDRAKLLSTVLDNVTRSDGHRLQFGMFRLDIRRKVHLEGVTALEQVPGEVVENLSSEVSKALLNSWLNLSPAGNSPVSHWRLDQRPPPFPPNHRFCLLFQPFTFTALQGLMSYKSDLQLALLHTLSEPLNPWDFE